MPTGNQDWIWWIRGEEKRELMDWLILIFVVIITFGILDLLSIGDVFWWMR
jgi:hypothetical protein